MFSDIFCQLLKKYNTNPLRLAKEINVPKSVVYEWKTGAREPSVENMVKLSEFFGVTLEYLAGQPEPSDSEERELFVMLRAAKEISRDDHDELVDSFKRNLNAYLHSKSSYDRN